MRINVYDYPDIDDYDSDGPILAGWFDSAKADRWSDVDYNGNGGRGVGRGEALNRTAGGRWVLEYWTRWQGEDDSYQFISDEQAKDWLLRHEQDDAVTQYFGPIEEERGPGRPEIGGRITTALGDDLLAKVEEWATEHGISRAQAVRDLIAAGLER